jgi:hypothetical protein
MVYAVMFLAAGAHTLQGAPVLIQQHQPRSCLQATAGCCRAPVLLWLKAHTSIAAAVLAYT